MDYGRYVAIKINAHVIAIVLIRTPPIVKGIKFYRHILIHALKSQTIAAYPQSCGTLGLNGKSQTVGAVGRWGGLSER